MKITKNQLKKIIREELVRAHNIYGDQLDEGFLDWAKNLFKKNKEQDSAQSSQSAAKDQTTKKMGSLQQVTGSQLENVINKIEKFNGLKDVYKEKSGTLDPRQLENLKSVATGIISSASMAVREFFEAYKNSSALSSKDVQDVVQAIGVKGLHENETKEQSSDKIVIDTLKLIGTKLEALKNLINKFDYESFRAAVYEGDKSLLGMLTTLKKEGEKERAAKKSKERQPINFPSRQAVKR